jgi:hypothetical protein
VFCFIGGGGGGCVLVAVGACGVGGAGGVCDIINIILSLWFYLQYQ